MVLLYINMNLPQVYTCSPSWTPLLPPSPYHPSGSFQCTSPKHPVSWIKSGLVIHFIYDIIHVSMPFFQIIPPSPSPTSPKDCSIHLCLFSWLAYRVIVTIFLNSIYMHSVQFSHSVMSDSATPWITAHQASLSITNSRSLLKLMSIESVMPSNHLILVVHFSSCPQSLPAPQSFPMSQLFAWGGQSTGVSTLASFLPKKSQGWFPSEWTGWISLQSMGLSRVFSNTTVQKH